MAKRRLKSWRDRDEESLAGPNLTAGMQASPSAIEPSPSPTLPDFDADDFRSRERIDNPYFPLLRGFVYTYGNVPEDEDDDVERNDLFASFENKSILGVNTHVVRHTEYANGLVTEDTLDYFAQDRKGNVWYFGELSYSFEYDEDGNFLGTSTDGSWLADGVTAFPGYIMPTREVLEALGNGYYQEFAPGIAEDQADLVRFDAKSDLEIGLFRDVLKTLDTTQLEPDQREFKKYEPGVGMVAAEEILPDGEVEVVEELLGIRRLKEGEFRKELFDDRRDPDLKDLIEEDIGVGDFEQPEFKEFRSAGSKVHVTYLGGETESNNALGVYTFDRETGLIDNVDILFPETEGLVFGEKFVVQLEEGEGYGLFLVPNGAEIGLDLKEFEGGGLEMRNFLTGKQASIHDRLAPQVVAEDGTVLPVPVFHALDTKTRDDWNLLNPAGGIHAVELESEALDDSRWDDKADILGFEDMFATDPERDGDFDDVVVAVSRAALPAGLLADVAEDLNLAGTAV